MWTKWAYAGWIAFGALLIVVLRDLLTKWATWTIEHLAGLLFKRADASRRVRRRALAAYRRKLTALYAQLSNSFLENQFLSLRDVYVPLTLTASTAPTSVDAYSAIRMVKHAVILGAPGAGKSTLLKHSVLGWAEAPWDQVAHAPVPVILDLHRCDHNTDDLEHHLIAQLDRTGFPRATQFVRRALQTGGMSVFLDGFDEVTSAQRPRVAELIGDFAARYHHVQVIVTCRSAVYSGQLAAMAPATFRVDEFDDRLVQRFLHAWPAISGAQADRLIAALQDAPRVFQLARNPLMLTMIAFLYGGSTPGRQLPHHRFDFYQQVVEELLSRRKETLNQFPWQLKKKLLQACAGAALDAVDQTDRLALPYESVLLLIKNELRALEVAGATAEAILTEIVERSGLLVPVDGGQSYMFAHLTLQEYLAAIELADDAGGLLDRYAADPTRWRETVKLWCAVRNVDSTQLIQTIRRTDPVLAFECLTEAGRVDDELARELIVASEALLADAGGRPTHPIVAAFGLVAADTRARGRSIFQFLAEEARSGDPARAVPAINALAATTLPEAVRILAGLAGNFPPAREALARVGDLAVPGLVELAAHTEWAIEALRNIGTPAAAVALTGLLWRTDSTAYRAAWHVAALMGTPSVDDALATAVVPRTAAGTAKWRWVWAPWSSGPDDPRTAVVARITELLGDEEATAQRPPVTEVLDHRIVMALTVIGRAGRYVGGTEVVNPRVHEAASRIVAASPSRNRYFYSGWPQSPTEPVSMLQLKRMLTARSGVPARSADHDVVRDWLLRRSTDANIIAILESADDRLYRPIVDRIINFETVNRRNWGETRSGPTTDFVRTRSRWFLFPLGLLWAAILAGLGLSIARLTGQWHWGPWWLAWFAVVAVPVFWISHVASDDAEPSDLLSTTTSGLAMGGIWAIDGVDALDRSTGTGIALGWCGIVLCDVYCAVGLASVVGWPATIALLAAAAVAVGVLWRSGLARQRRAENPLPSLMALVSSGHGSASILTAPSRVREPVEDDHQSGDDRQSGEASPPSTALPAPSDFDSVSSDALRHANALRRSGEPLDTRTLLVAVGRVHVLGHWDRVWLHCGRTLDDIADRDDVRDPNEPGERWNDVDLTAACAAALRAAAELAGRRGVAIAPGILVLGLLRDHTAGAARAIGVGSTISRRDLLALIDEELLGGLAGDDPFGD